MIDVGVMIGVRKVNNLIDSALSAGQQNPITAWQDLIFDDATGEYLGTVDKNSEYYYDSIASSERCTKYLQDIEDGKLPYEVKKKLTADEANATWKNKHKYSDPPYSKNYVVFEAITQKLQHFVRLAIDEDGIYGGWLMLEEDIIGLSSEQIRSKYSLSFVSKFICDVYIPEGIQVRIGATSSL